MFNTRLDTFGNDFGHFSIFKNFRFFWKFSKTRPSMAHWAKKIFEKLNPKHVQITFGQFWERFWIFFWKFENFLIFLKIFGNSTFQGTLGKKTFSKKSPQNIFKTRLDTFGNECGHFWNFESFLIFLKIFGDSTLHRTLGKKIFGKVTPKHVQNTFEHFWERFWALLQFWKVFDFFENFRRLDPPWNTGQKNFSK